jgi:MYXO-CTERM domain-containing protein
VKVAAVIVATVLFAFVLIVVSQVAAVALLLVALAVAWRMSFRRQHGN